MYWKIFANDVTDKGLISKVYKQVIQLHCKKNHPTETWAEYLNRDMSPKKTYKWPIGRWKDAHHTVTEMQIKTRLNQLHSNKNDKTMSLYIYIYIYIYIHTSHHGHVTPVKMAILKKSIKGKKMSTKGPPRCSPVVKGLCFHRRGYGHHPWPERQGPACCVAHPKKEKNKPQNDTNEHTRETETDSQNRLVVKDGQEDWESGTGNMHTIICRMHKRSPCCTTQGMTFTTLW